MIGCDAKELSLSVGIVGHWNLHGEGVCVLILNDIPIGCGACRTIYEARFDALAKFSI